MIGQAKTQKNGQPAWWALVGSRELSMVERELSRGIVRNAEAARTAALEALCVAAQGWNEEPGAFHAYAQHRVQDAVDAARRHCPSNDSVRGSLTPLGYIDELGESYPSPERLAVVLEDAYLAQTAEPGFLDVACAA